MSKRGEKRLRSIASIMHNVGAYTTKLCLHVRQLRRATDAVVSSIEIRRVVRITHDSRGRSESLSHPHKTLKAAMLTMPGAQGADVAQICKCQ